MLGAVSSDVYNDYSILTQFQRGSSIQPVENPVTVPEEEFRHEIPIEKQMEIKDNISQKMQEYQQERQAQKNDARAFLTDYAGIQSAKTQFEILLEGINSEDDVLSNDENMIESIQTLRDIQEQNNTVQAYATYREWQK